MRISQKLDYASRLLGQMELQRARRYHLVLRFGFAPSRRGKTGGWKLAKAPSQITLLEIVNALEPEALGSHHDVAGESGPVVTNTYAVAQKASRAILQKATLEVMAASSEPMYFI